MKTAYTDVLCQINLLLRDPGLVGAASRWLTQRPRDHLFGEFVRCKCKMTMESAAILQKVKTERGFAHHFCHSDDPKLAAPTFCSASK